MIQIWIVNCLAGKSSVTMVCWTSLSGISRVPNAKCLPAAGQEVRKAEVAGIHVGETIGDGESQPNQAVWDS